MSETDSKEGARRQGRKPPKKATPEYLERAALYYLERYASSAANLRRVLLRKVRRSAEAHGTDPLAGAEAVDALIARFLASGLLDDRLYAQGRARSLHRRGNSTRTIRSKLATKGVGENEIEGALAEIEEAVADPELAAALAYAKRRRLGPFRAPAARAERREQDLAALGRQGFGYALARRVIDSEDPEALQEEARRGNLFA